MGYKIEASIELIANSVSQSATEFGKLCKELTQILYMVRPLLVDQMEEYQREKFHKANKVTR